MSIHLTPEREEKFKYKIANMQFNLGVVLENVHDSHNIGAVIRSCDAVGVGQIYIVDTHPEVQKKKAIQKSSSTGVARWQSIHQFTDLDACMAMVKKNHEHVLGTHLTADSSSIYSADLTGSIALVFGNEHAGITEEMLAYCDANVIIPQKGMVQSLNISVACAVSLFEALRQRTEADAYKDDYNAANPLEFSLLESYKDIQLAIKRR